MLRRLFKEHGARNAVTLFHNPSVPASCRILSQLKAAHAAGEAKPEATPARRMDSSSSQSPKFEKYPKPPQAPFDLDIVETPPTPDQLKTILEYLGSQQASKVVDGARSPEEAAVLISRNPKVFTGPLVVDWNAGKAVLGDDQPELLELLKSIPRE